MLKHEMFILSWKHPKEEWLTFYNQGLTDYELAKVTGASLRTVRRWRKENGLPCHPKPRIYSKVNASNFIALYMMRYIDKEIAQLVGCSKSTVTRWRKEHNLEPRGKHGFKADGSYAGKVFLEGQSYNRGAEHWNWKGGVSLDGNEFYWSSEWKEVRDYVFKRDNYCCRACGQRGGNLLVHHIISRREKPELALEPSNLITLHRSCHIKVERNKLKWS